jgi:outer membrane lipoprotein-sorting protein
MNTQNATAPVHKRLSPAGTAIVFCMAVMVAFPAGSADAACPEMTPGQAYQRLKKEVLSRKSYTATYAYLSERGRDHEIYSRRKTTGRYLKDPAWFCEKRLSMDASFKEQAGRGFQECYTGDDDITRRLLPGPLRLIGLVPLYPEDPKADYLNGENLKRAAVWTWFDKWDRMIVGGDIEAECKDRDGVPHILLTIQRGRVPDPVYNHDKAIIWINTETWFPMKVEYYVPGDPKPVLVYDFEEVALDVPLTDKEMGFEGAAPKWNLISFPERPELKRIKAGQPKLSNQGEQDKNSILEMLGSALEKIRDYTTKMTVTLRYRRLRQVREEDFRYVPSSGAFFVTTRELKANYIMPSGGAGFKMAYNPDVSPLIHIIPAGVFKNIGAQSFPPDDPRLFSAIGDSVTHLNFFAIRDELERRLKAAVKVRTARAAYSGASGPWIEVAEHDMGIPKRPTVMRLLLDENSHLPLILQYGGYDDPDAFLLVRFEGTEVNAGRGGE